MSQSLANLLLHIIFSTKQRVPFLATHDVREAMNGYLVGTLRNLGCPSIIVGCVSDHVHILCNLSRTLTVAQLLEEAKKSSSVWIKSQHEALGNFHWQGGYGAFSVSQSNVAAVKQYIADQERHHLTRSFQDEFRLFLQRHGVAFDERYVWD